MQIIQEIGEYDNRSKFIRVDAAADVKDGGIDTRYLPAGFIGPLRYKPFTLMSGSANVLITGSASTHSNAMVMAGTSIPLVGGGFQGA